MADPGQKASGGNAGGRGYDDNRVRILEADATSDDDAEDILALQKLAYRSEAEIYNDFHIPPLDQTLEDMKADIQRQVVLKAVMRCGNGRIVGSVRAFSKDGTCHIGRLIVDPDLQRRGIGTALMGAIEGRFNEATRYELFTGDRSEGNIRLYERLGYRRFKSERASDSLTLVYMEKKGGTSVFPK
jgi:ribosomal protein S18 acetylase RimI-like enzyme